MISFRRRWLFVREYRCCHECDHQKIENQGLLNDGTHDGKISEDRALKRARLDSWNLSRLSLPIFDNLGP